MKFAAVFTYQHHDKITAIRPSHREYLSSLEERGKLWMAGPFIDDSGALIIYDAESEDEALEIIKHDPFSKSDIFASFQMKEWNQVF